MITLRDFLPGHFPEVPEMYYPDLNYWWFDCAFFMIEETLKLKPLFPVSAQNFNPLHENNIFFLQERTESKNSKSENII